MSSYTKILTALKNHLKVLVAIGLTITCFYGGVAQKDTNFKKLHRDAFGLYAEQRYSEAKPLFLQLQKNSPDNFDYNYGLGICLLFEGNDSSVFYFDQCLNLEEPFPDKLYYYLGRAHHIHSNFETAIVHYNSFLSRLSASNEFDYFEKKEIKYAVYEELIRCRHGLDLACEKQSGVAINLGSEINSAYDEYAPLVNYNENTLIYTATKPDIYSSKYHIQNREYSEDVYFANWSDKKEQWIAQHIVPTNQKKNRSQAALFLSLKGDRLIYYEGKEYSPKVSLYDKDLKNTRWQSPEKFAKKLHKDYDVRSFFLSHDEQVIIFSSDKHGGYGGLDLYIMKQDLNGVWSLPENMGPMINTPYNEDAPYLMPDNITLFYCSNNLSSMGGYDIFVSQAKSFGDWQVPKNLGLGVNSGGDDLFPSVGFQTNTLYFSSHRAGGYGYDDIYKVSLEEVLPKYIPCTIVNKQKNDLVTEIKYESAPYGLVRNLQPEESFTYYLPEKKEVSFSATYVGQVYQDDTFTVSPDVCNELLNTPAP